MIYSYVINAGTSQVVNISEVPVQPIQISENLIDQEMNSRTFQRFVECISTTPSHEILEEIYDASQEESILCRL